MEIIKLRVRGNMAEVTDAPAVITSGTVGLPVEFTFDDRWDGLSKTAVFRAGCTAKTVTNLQAQAIVPWEVLEKPNCWLQIGVYGVNADGSVAIPTLWANVCVIHTGTDPEADPALDPTLPVWQEIWNTVSGLSQEALPDNVANAICPGIENPTPADAFMALFNGKAPAGFGLGGIAKGITDMNTATDCGFFCFSSGCANAPFDYGVGFSLNRYGTQYSQVAFNPYLGGCGEIAIRHDDKTGWKEWEYVNPPLYFGVEYRTTERWNGKPVYTQLIDLISYAKEDEWFIEHGETSIEVALDVENLVDAKFTVFDGDYHLGNLFHMEFEDLSLEVQFVDGEIDLHIFDLPFDRWTDATLLLKYTKTN